MKVHCVGHGIYANSDETLHFTQNNDEKIFCFETGEIFEPEEFIIEEEVKDDDTVRKTP